MSARGNDTLPATASALAQNGRLIFHRQEQRETGDETPGSVVKHSRGSGSEFACVLGGRRVWHHWRPLGPQLRYHRVPGRCGIYGGVPTAPLPANWSATMFATFA
jgi:hypothetical protein